MKIVFNGLRSGLGNNGGTRTILKSAQVLEALGHQCEIASVVDNFTWFDHKKIINCLPSDFDVVINIAAVDYGLTKNCNIKKKYAWWRLKESYSMSEASLVNCFLDETVHNIVNSKGLQYELSKYGADSQVVYQGIDFGLWKDKSLRTFSKLRIGCLFSNKDRKRWRDFVRLHSLLGDKDYEYVAFGAEYNEDDFLSTYLLHPTHSTLVDFYSTCDVWFAPTVDEGLHNPPMEAALCGAKLVCSDCKSNGMVLDYATNDTAIIYPQGEIEYAASLIDNPEVIYDEYLIRNMYFKLRNMIGTRENNMKRFLAILGAWR